MNGENDANANANAAAGLEMGDDDGAALQQSTISTQG